MSDEMRELTLDHVRAWGFGERGVRAINETGNSEAMFALLDSLTGVRAQLVRDRALCNRWIEAALRSAGTLGVAFDPMNPEGWMHSQTAFVLGLLEEKKSLAAQAASVQELTCQWRVMDFPESSSDFESECGGAWSFNDGGIEENEVKYCCRCGGRVLPPIPPSFDGDEDEEEEQEASK